MGIFSRSLYLYPTLLLDAHERVRTVSHSDVYLFEKQEECSDFCLDVTNSATTCLILIEI